MMIVGILFGLVYSELPSSSNQVTLLQISSTKIEAFSERLYFLSVVTFVILNPIEKSQL